LNKGEVFAQSDGWRYEKLPIAGDLLSGYTKANAGDETPKLHEFGYCA